MPTFVIEREIPNAGSMTQAQIEEISKRALENMNGSGIAWLHSYVTDDKIYCVYVAPDAETVATHGSKTHIPVNRVSEVRRLLNIDETRKA